MKFLIVIFVLCVIQKFSFALTSEEILDVTDACCTHGQSYAQNAETCAGARPPDDIEDEEKEICNSALKSCCEDQLQQKKECALGMKLAESKQCNSPNSDIGKMCCNECSFGQLSGESQGKLGCGEPSEDFYSPTATLRKNAYYQCCMAAAEEPETTTKAKTTTLKPDVKETCKTNSCEHICKEDRGRIHCECRQGFRLQPDNKSCKDINECAEAEDDLCLAADTVCHNTEGSFRCVPLNKREVGLSCPPGFKRNVVNQVCDDINECQLPRPPCPKYLCVNTIGGYKCSGKPGKPFVEEVPGVTTEAVVTPALRNDICPPGFRAGDDDECLDIDECGERLDDCQHLSQHCINTHGSYFCQDHVSKRCAPGFKVNPSSGICEDIDECEESLEVCKRSEVCVNLPGAYNCKSKISTLPKLATKKCREGTRVRPGGSICEDIDECREGTHLCDQFQNCINTFGGHECRCKNGFELDSSSGSCIDIDECALKLDNCERGMTCLNVQGSFTCSRRGITTTSTNAPPIYDYEYYDSEEEENITEPKPETTSSTTTTTPRPTTTTTTTTPRPTTTSTTTTPRSTTTTTTTTPRPTTTSSTTTRRPYQNPRRYPYYPRTTSTSQPQRRPYYPRTTSTTEIPDETNTEIPSKPDNPDDKYPYIPNPINNRRPDDSNKPTTVPVERNPYDREPENRLPNRRPRPNPDTDKTTEIPRPTARRPDERPHFYPRRPTTLTEVTVTAPTDINTIERDRTPEGAYDIDTGNIPKDKWTNVIGKDPVESEFDPILIHCLNGFERNERGECIDIDECEVGRHICSTLEICKNRPGGYQCDCISGFTRDGSGWCAPIITARTTSTTPRTTSTSSTTTSTTPRTTVYDTEVTTASTTPVWHYQPNEGDRPRASCNQGFYYNFTERRCVDIDECSTSRANCLPKEDCINTDGGYRCECGRHCRGDFIPSYVPRDPEPMPETNIITVGAQYGRRGSRYMRPTYTRLPDTGSIVATCLWGYKLTPEKHCIDIDECERKVSDCGPEQKCENFYGGYSCQCPGGHRLVGKRCEDVDECKFGNPCSYNSRCINTVGSYRCECGEGFRNAPSNEKVCVDVDECAESSSLCEHSCANAWGGYRCYCNRGFRLRSDNRTCEDIDECTEGGSAISRRLCGGRCVNTPGSYKCACPSGYRLADDARSCIDVDECENGLAQCGREPGSVCQNTRGGYHCHNIRCPPGYKLEGKHKCSRIQRSCLISDWDCLQRPSTYSYNFITFVSNIFLPLGRVDLFTMHGPAWRDSVVSFEMRMIDVQASPGVKPTDLSCFEMRPTGNTCVVSLLCSLAGPQVAELELTMSLYQRAQFAGSAVARLVVIVSEYEF
ncbi:unnamed protein product [Pieris macdunnoughi]|uniref:Fibulin-1 n=1 Tax=Pieris macdunnoughi TaxID=345717 RepID=A0A821WCW9_9NEOP|nr:unnamed protein product [Pieris macdunnoughi]